MHCRLMATTLPVMAVHMYSLLLQVFYCIPFNLSPCLLTLPLLLLSPPPPPPPPSLTFPYYGATLYILVQACLLALLYMASAIVGLSTLHDIS